MRRVRARPRAIWVFSMNSELKGEPRAKLQACCSLRATQLEFDFARATGVTVENLKRLRALRRARLPARPYATGNSSAVSTGG